MRFLSLLLLAGCPKVPAFVTGNESFDESVASYPKDGENQTPIYAALWMLQSSGVEAPMGHQTYLRSLGEAGLATDCPCEKGPRHDDSLARCMIPKATCEEAVALTRFHRARIFFASESPLLPPRERELRPLEVLEVGGLPCTGPDDGLPVVVFTDLMCPACRDTVKRIEDWAEADGDVRVCYRATPSRDFEPASTFAATAAAAAHAQGKYFELRDALGTSRIVEPGFAVEVAARAGLDPARFAQDLAGRGRDSLRSDVTEADRLGVAALPTIFMAGRWFTDTPDARVLSAWAGLERSP